MYEYIVKRLTTEHKGGPFHDGDTVFLDIDMGLRLVLTDMGVRFFGLNCPEIGDKDPAVRARAEAAREFVVVRLSGDVQMKMRTMKPYPDDKYGRWLCRLYYRPTPKTKKAAVNLEGLDGWKCINEELLSAGHALPYDGKGAKPV